MTNIYQNPRTRNIFVSNGGNDSYNGFTDDFPKRELSSAVSAATALVPTIAEPVTIIENGGTRYTGDFVFPDYVRVELTNSSINDGSITLPDTSNVFLYSLLTPFQTDGLSPKTACNSNGKSRASLTCA